MRRALAMPASVVAVGQRSLVVRLASSSHAVHSDTAAAAAVKSAAEAVIGKRSRGRPRRTPASTSPATAAAAEASSSSSSSSSSAVTDLTRAALTARSAQPTAAVTSSSSSSAAAAAAAARQPSQQQQQRAPSPSQTVLASAEAAASTAAAQMLRKRVTLALRAVQEASRHEHVIEWREAAQGSWEHAPLANRQQSTMVVLDSLLHTDWVCNLLPQTARAVSVGPGTASAASGAADVAAASVASAVGAGSGASAGAGAGSGAAAASSASTAAAIATWQSARLGARSQPELPVLAQFDGMGKSAFVRGLVAPLSAALEGRRVELATFSAWDELAQRKRVSVGDLFYEVFASLAAAIDRAQGTTEVSERVQLAVKHSNPFINAKWRDALTAVSNCLLENAASGSPERVSHALLFLDNVDLTGPMFTRLFPYTPHPADRFAQLLHWLEWVVRVPNVHLVLASSNRELAVPTEARLARTSAILPTYVSLGALLPHHIDEVVSGVRVRAPPAAGSAAPSAPLRSAAELMGIDVTSPSGAMPGSEAGSAIAVSPRRVRASLSSSPFAQQVYAATSGVPSVVVHVLREALRVSVNDGVRWREQSPESINAFIDGILRVDHDSGGSGGGSSSAAAVAQNPAARVRAPADSAAQPPREIAAARRDAVAVQVPAEADAAASREHVGERSADAASAPVPVPVPSPTPTPAPVRQPEEARRNARRTLDVVRAAAAASMPPWVAAGSAALLGDARFVRDITELFVNAQLGTVMNTGHPAGRHVFELCNRLSFDIDWIDSGAADLAASVEAMRRRAVANAQLREQQQYLEQHQQQPHVPFQPVRRRRGRRLVRVDWELDEGAANVGARFTVRVPDRFLDVVLDVVQRGRVPFTNDSSSSVVSVHAMPTHQMLEMAVFLSQARLLALGALRGARVGDAFPLLSASPLADLRILPQPITYAALPMKLFATPSANLEVDVVAQHLVDPSRSPYMLYHDQFLRLRSMMARSTSASGVHRGVLGYESLRELLGPSGTATASHVLVRTMATSAAPEIIIGVNCEGGQRLLLGVLSKYRVTGSDEWKPSDMVRFANHFGTLVSVVEKSFFARQGANRVLPYLLCLAGPGQGHLERYSRSEPYANGSIRNNTLRVVKWNSNSLQLVLPPVADVVASLGIGANVLGEALAAASPGEIAAAGLQSPHDAAATSSSPATSTARDERTAAAPSASAPALSPAPAHAPAPAPPSPPEKRRRGRPRNDEVAAREAADAAAIVEAVAATRMFGMTSAGATAGSLLDGALPLGGISVIQPGVVSSVMPASAVSLADGLASSSIPGGEYLSRFAGVGSSCGRTGLSERLAQLCAARLSDSLADAVKRRSTLGETCVLLAESRIGALVPAEADVQFAPLPFKVMDAADIEYRCAPKSVAEWNDAVASVAFSVQPGSRGKDAPRVTSKFRRISRVHLAQMFASAPFAKQHMLLRAAESSSSSPYILSMLCAGGERALLGIVPVYRNSHGVRVVDARDHVERLGDLLAHMPDRVRHLYRVQTLLMLVAPDQGPMGARARPRSYAPGELKFRAMGVEKELMWASADLELVMSPLSLMQTYLRISDLATFT